MSETKIINTEQPTKKTAADNLGPRYEQALFMAAAVYPSSGYDDLSNILAWLIDEVGDIVSEDENNERAQRLLARVKGLHKSLEYVPEVAS